MPYTAQYKKIKFYRDVFELYRAYADAAPSVLLESAKVSPEKGRYSIIAARPTHILEYKNKQTFLTARSGKALLRENPLAALRRLVRARQSSSGGAALPFTGGAVGFFSYEARHLLEPGLSATSKDDLNLPDVYFLFFDKGLIIDHEKKCTYLFRHSKNKISARGFKTFERDVRRRWASRRPLRWYAPEPKKITINAKTSKSTFIRNVKTIKRFIANGDIYQANLSQRFDFKLPKDALSVYASLRKINPSAFFAYLDAGSFQILSGSPERLLRLNNGMLDTRPIAGTRPRGARFGADKKIANDLMLNPKERAEHIMLVDLERNDLGRVCEFGSVVVNELMALENYSHVKHIVSNVRGALRKDKDAFDAFQAFFPGGTITGTPKIRCMNILDRLEGVARGPYTGSLGYFSFTGNMDFNIIIRSLVVKNNTAFLQVGAGIVADSIPEREYDETLYKAKGVLAGIFGEKKASQILRSLGTRN